MKSCAFFQSKIIRFLFHFGISILASNVPAFSECNVDIHLKACSFLSKVLLFVGQSDSYEITMNGYQARQIDEIKNEIFGLQL